jgi:hypothetical protein
MLAHKVDLSKLGEELRREKAELKASHSVTVVFGTHTVSRTEAIARTNFAIAKVDADIASLDQRLEQLATRLKERKVDEPLA